MAVHDLQRFLYVLHPVTQVTDLVVQALQRFPASYYPVEDEDQERAAPEYQACPRPPARSYRFPGDFLQERPYQLITGA